MNKINELAQAIGKEFYDRAGGFPDNKESERGHDAYVARTAAMQMARAFLEEAEKLKQYYQPYRERYEVVYLPDLRALFSEQGKQDEAQYPCTKCGVLRTKAEGGTVFTVCDECWEEEAGAQRVMLRGKREGAKGFTSHCCGHTKFVEANEKAVCWLCDRPLKPPGGADE